MYTDIAFAMLRESLYMLVVFGVFLVLALVKGRYILINLIFGLYFGLLFSLKFPYFDLFTNGMSTTMSAVTRILILVVFTIASMFLFRRHIPGDDYEPTFSHIGKKVLLATMATALVMAYSYHAIPVTDIYTPGSPIRALFAGQSDFFWWLIAPFVVLFFI